MPWIQNEDLEGQRGGGNEEVGDGESTSDLHFDVGAERRDGGNERWLKSRTRGFCMFLVGGERLISRVQRVEDARKGNEWKKKIRSKDGFTATVGKEMFKCYHSLCSRTNNRPGQLVDGHLTVPGNCRQLLLV